MQLVHLLQLHNKIVKKCLRKDTNFNFEMLNIQKLKVLLHMEKIQLMSYIMEPLDLDNVTFKQNKIATVAKTTKKERKNILKL